jgi:hypothetical protein
MTLSLPVVTPVCWPTSLAILPGMARDEPDEVDLKIERARARMDRGRVDLISAIREALDAGRGVTRIGRHAGWSREYIAQIRDGDAQ